MRNKTRISPDALHTANVAGGWDLTGGAISVVADLIWILGEVITNGHVHPYHTVVFGLLVFGLLALLKGGTVIRQAIKQESEHTQELEKEFDELKKTVEQLKKNDKSAFL